MTYVVLATLYVAAALLLLLFSSHDYTWYLVGDVLLTVAFGFYSVYFFSVRHYFAVRREKYLEKVLFAIPAKEYGVYLRSEGNVTKEGVTFQALIFRIKGDEREICSFREDVAFTEGEEYLLECGAGVLTAFEVRK